MTRAAGLRPQARRLLVLAGLIVALLTYRLAIPGPPTAGDGQYSWIFARSLAFDGDLDLANDYALCGDPWKKGTDEGAGRPANPFYFGPGLVHAPVLFVLRKTMVLRDAPPSWRAGCDGPLVRGTLSISVLFAALTLWLGFRLARRWAGEGASLLAMVTVAFGTSLAHYAAVLPSYSHTLAALGVALALTAWTRARSSGTRLREWTLTGVAIGFAALMRPQQAALLVVPAFTLAASALRRVRARRWPWREAAAGAATIAGFAVLFSIQLYVYRVLYGHYWVIPQGKVYLQLGHAHPWLSLFFPRGLFAWTPLAWLGFTGIGVMIARRPSRSVGLALSAWMAIEIYVASAALVWTGAGTFGSRVLVSLTAPLVVGTAITFDAIGRWLAARPNARGLALVAGLATPAIFFLFSASFGQRINALPDGEAIRSSTHMYSEATRIGFSEIDRSYGNPFVWPASLVFAARYGLHPRRFEDFAEYGMFAHAYRPVKLEGEDTIDFTSRSTQELLVEGLSRGPAGCVLRAPHARFLVTLAWPFITHVRIEADAPLGRPVTLKIRSGSFFRRHDVGAISIAPGQTTQAEIAVPRGAFDSGINEVLLDADEDIVLRKWKWIDQDEHDTRVY
jgi:hypothetical protein